MIPSEPLWPWKFTVRVKFDFGSFPVPWLWNGPEKVNDTGLVIVFEPDGVTVRLKWTWPLLIEWEPRNVSWRSCVASPPLPHAARANAARAAATSAQAYRGIRWG